MAMEISNWHELLSLVNVDKDLSKDNVVEKIQNELKRYSKEYEEWEKSGFDINYVFKDGEKVTLLHLAASCDLENIVNALIEKGANVNEKGAGGETPLHEITHLKSINIANILIKKGADVNSIDMWGETPLCGAVLCDNMVMVDVLIKEGADVNVVDTFRRTPLHWAALRGNMVMVDALIKKGADVNSVDMCGETPLHYLNRPAIKKGQIAAGAATLLGAAISVALFAARTVTAEFIPIVIAVVAITVAALTVGSVTYKLLKPNTKVDGVAVLTNVHEESASITL
ncbi:ankyrin repeat domain-containing protein [Wolbachia endosymbiont of Diaphorina citri]|jgi:FOG: Ankyrin repeat|uniref:ankyrin repeat domain-containing protein n=2 Tax=Wolbachia endosymbiont of Diaphorina citri TaxID=116598 RepID=UPI0002DE4E91|nr:ankyrin repeat domain-containing protein [Wolbachia endosymbiont of Diaphorina citri]